MHARRQTNALKATELSIQKFSPWRGDLSWSRAAVGSQRAVHSLHMESNCRPTEWDELQMWLAVCPTAQAANRADCFNARPWSTLPRPVLLSLAIHPPTPYCPRRRRRVPCSVRTCDVRRATCAHSTRLECCDAAMLRRCACLPPPSLRPPSAGMCLSVPPSVVRRPPSAVGWVRPALECQCKMIVRDWSKAWQSSRSRRCAACEDPSFIGS